MPKILGRALSAAAVAGIATLARAAPAPLDPTPSGLVGNDLEGIGTLSQSLNNGNGNTQTGATHSQNVANHALSNNIEAQEVKIISDITALSENVIAA
ncbi:hypothetical protein OG429_00500 [Streptomyces sp. NBC_00190]|uniref:hypothetical protein n=1 Tax=unclassified Streptomyces TaxID=2593676 RepID=UPI002E2A63D7|nr:hypothetical protein [Streptomyces sp. NBC_00190]WSZ37960.1 hypothetical protein OG239_03460 [Streptomyces sp. NBC_00868]